MKKITLPILLLVVIIAFVLITSEKTQTQKTLTFGFLGPLSGDAASYGQTEKNATELAVHSLNDRGGELGKTLSVIFEDGKCNGKDAATAVQKLITSDEIKIILGGVCSGETLAIAPITEQNKIILFSAFSTNPDVSSAGDFVFRNTPSDKDVAEGVANLVINDGNTMVALLSENTEYAQSVRNQIKNKFQKLSKQPVSDEIFPQGARDVRAQLLKIKNSNPDAVIIVPQSGITAGISARQIQELGIKSKLYGAGTSTFTNSDAYSSGGKSLNGLKFTDAPGLNPSNQKAVQFLSDYTKTFGKPASDFEAGARYDSVFIIADAIEACKKVDPECIKDYLYSMPDYHGVIGTYHFDSNGDPVGLQTFTVKQIINAEKGEIKEIE